MKLLIVDDEELTRTGVISSINWEELGITEIFQADDGINGLQMAQTYRPEIILCDVRMPRMDGITMLERLESILPDSIPVFMSGYSDKEYLKAAIKLRAVNYIEKPLNPGEISETIKEAVRLHNQKLHSHRAETLHSMETASKLALSLTVPFSSQKEEIARLTEELSLKLSPSSCFTSLILHMSPSMEFSAEEPGKYFQEFKEFLFTFHMECLFVAKHSRYLISFIVSPSALSPAFLKKAGDFLKSRFERHGNFFLAAGDSLCGIIRAYQSYASAVILLQSSYFFPVSTLLTAQSARQTPSHMGQEIAALPGNEDFKKALSLKNKKQAEEFLDHLFHAFFQNPSFLPNQVKDLYYKLFDAVEVAERQNQLLDAFPGGSIMAGIEACFSYEELHTLLRKRTEDFFRKLSEAAPENPTIFLIKEYISDHYQNETLSVRDIGAHVFLSASYVCTFFKNETGKTLNQYLTEYRMEQAKQLLRDPRYKITDISSRVGYSDGNYFGKSFKKYTGLSPSEYREKEGV